ncbi:MAG: serine hydrolase [Terrisporobacter sp.]|uniref:D-alanyl-D-alanine carboxypeptidase family protein n=1 Tax=Terrisporobacter sp. TaxID=1965305 RepID=UPI002FCACE9C
MKKISTFILTLLIVAITSINSVASGLNNTSDIQNIIGQSAIVMDMDTGEIIASKNADVQRPMASTVKLLTSLIFAENTSNTQMIPFTSEALKTTQTSLNNLKRINVGEEISSNDLMKAVLKYSANDASYLMADSVAGNYIDFVKMMNDRAKSLGLKNTHIVNPCGLESNAVDPSDTEINLSTAYDMAIIAKEAYKNQWIRETVSDKSENLVINIGGQPVTIKSRNKIIGQDGNIGGKTGNESQAGHCFVGFFERDGRKLVTVVLNSIYGIDGTNVFKDTKQIADYGYGAKKEVFKKAGEEICKVDLEYRIFGFIGPKKKIEVPVIASKDIMYYKNNINDKNAKIEYKEEKKSPWRLVNKEIELNLSLPNYESKVLGKADLSLFDLIKISILPFILMVIEIIIVLVVVACILRFINIRKKRNERQRKRRRR